MRWFARVGSHLDIVQDCISHAKVTGSVGDVQSWIDTDGNITKWANVRQEGYLEDGVEYFEVKGPEDA